MSALIVLAILASVTIAVAAYRSGQSSVRRARREETRPVQLNDSPDLTQQTRKLEEQVDNLNELNRRYLAFIVNVSSVLQRLNMTLSSKEIISSITHMVRNVISTDVVQVYIFDTEDNLLKRVGPSGQTREEEVSVSLGEGLVGMAAQNASVRIRGRCDKETPDQKSGPDSHLWLAVPINFGSRLFGIIGIGQVRNPSGNESQLMKIIADIAGVALINRSLLGEAKQEANTDPLTELNNRRYFFRMAEVVVEKAIREGNTPVSIFLFDVDNFKHYNDTNGHEEGDTVLKELARLVTEVTRKNCVVARFGGEEFIVMLPGITKEDAFVYAERLRETISAHPFPNREKQPLGCLSISGGVACFPVDARSKKGVIRLADASLYRAKSEGRNRVVMNELLYFSDLAKKGEKCANA